MSDPKLILVTGATGYVGGHLVPRLLEEGYRVRVLVRDARKLKGIAWAENVQMAVGDVLAPDTLGPALADVHAGYYLVHSMTGGTDFAEQDLTAARNFGEAAQQAGVQRVVYLGGLGDPSASLSKHLRSRHETGAALRSTGVCLTEFRAAIIVGSGSISFEMIRYLTERVPTMICPRWVRTRVQPIAIEDVISYLVTALENTQSADQIIEIGGRDVFTYGDMMKGYAHVRGLPRWLVHVPVLTPRLSSYWVHWVTPMTATYARPLIEGLRSEVVVREDRASEYFPEIKPSRYAHAVQQALAELDPRCFQDALADLERITDPDRLVCCSKIDRGMIIEIRQMVVRAPAGAVYQAFTELGGSNGWPCQFAWRVRAVLDRWVGGVGMRRGRPESGHIKPGDTVDFFRVVKVDPQRMIRLKADMKLPGEGWLQFEAEPMQDGFTRLVQTAFFAPKGLLGVVYWYVLLPVHKLIFDRMIKTLAAQAEHG
jgi:uncharacterized protein YbjT (DUF2867 family)